MTQEYRARIKPYDPDKGHLIKRYTFKGKTFIVEHGWYGISEGRAKELRNRVVNGQYVFDVATVAEAEEMERAAAEAEETHHGPTAVQKIWMTEDERAELEALRREKARAEARRRAEKLEGATLADVMARYSSLSVDDLLGLTENWPMKRLEVLYHFEQTERDRPAVLGPLGERLNKLQAEAHAPAEDGAEDDDEANWSLHMKVDDVMAELEDADLDELERVLTLEQAQKKPRTTLVDQLERAINKKLEG